MPTSCYLFVALISCISTVFWLLFLPVPSLVQVCNRTAEQATFFFKGSFFLKGSLAQLTKKHAFKNHALFLERLSRLDIMEKYLLDLYLWCSFCFNKITWFFFNFQENQIQPWIKMQLPELIPLLSFFPRPPQCCFPKDIAFFTKAVCFLFLFVNQGHLLHKGCACYEWAFFFQRPPFAWFVSPLPFFKALSQNEQTALKNQAFPHKGLQGWKERFKKHSKRRCAFCCLSSLVPLFQRLPLLGFLVPLFQRLLPWKSLPQHLLHFSSYLPLFS